MEDLFAGDRISLTFDDMACDQITATVARTLSDTEEGLGPEIEAGDRRLYLLLVRNQS